MPERRQPQDGKMTDSSELKAIPSVDLVLRHVEEKGLLAAVPRVLAARAVRALLDRERDALLSAPERGAEDVDALRGRILRAAEADVAAAARAQLRPVVNATGVVIHTNLGRAPLSRAALDAIAATSAGYANLEYDLNEGTRGVRDVAVRDALCELCGAEAAVVTNNNAAAVLLALNTLAAGREVVISRSELIEIGGAFRLPEVFERSGSRMIAVGTTNRTRLPDYEDAVTNRTAAIMTAHWSNYEVVGFVERVALGDLVELGNRCGLPVIHDLGSGIIARPEDLELVGETTIADSLRAGVSVATVSGDKLLGGPQAGIALGERAVIEGMRSNPLMRALRPGKLTLAALQATLEQYLLDRHLTEIPVLSMLRAPVEGLLERARKILEGLGDVEARGAEVIVVEMTSRVGGGAAPERDLKSAGLAVASLALSADDLASRMRGARTPVIARTKDGRVLLDLRTVLPDQDRQLTEAIEEALGDTP